MARELLEVGHRVRVDLGVLRGGKVDDEGVVPAAGLEGVGAGSRAGPSPVPVGAAAGEQLALAADDAPLAASTVQGLFNLIAPLLRLRQASAFLLQPLCAVLRALQMLDRERLVAIRRAPQLLVCTTFGLTKLSQECGLGPLADFVAQTDVCTFAQSLATQYASQAKTWADAGMRGAVQASRVELKKLSLAACKDTSMQN